MRKLVDSNGDEIERRHKSIWREIWWEIASSESPLNKCWGPWFGLGWFFFMIFVVVSCFSVLIYSEVLK